MPSTKLLGHIALGLTALLTCSLLCLGQVAPPVTGRDAGNTRSIEGTVQDAAGKPIPGAIVLLKNTKTLQVRSYIAQSNGTYRFFGLSTDINYEVRAQANGFSSKTKTVSVFNSHRAVKLDLKVNKKLKS